jgi:hypothetical protein
MSSQAAHAVAFPADQLAKIVAEYLDQLAKRLEVRREVASQNLWRYCAAKHGLGSEDCRSQENELVYQLYLRAREETLKAAIAERGLVDVWFCSQRWIAFAQPVTTEQALDELLRLQASPSRNEAQWAAAWEAARLARIRSSFINDEV